MNESPISDSAEQPKQPAKKISIKVYSTIDDARDNIGNHQLHDVCRVIADKFQYYVLVDDIDGHKFWHPFDGVHLGEALMVNDAFKAGQKKYRDNPMTQQDVEDMRNILTAVATLAELFEYDEEAITTITDSAIVKFAFNLYKRDEKKPPELKLKDMEPKDPVLGSYVAKVTFVFNEYSEMLAKVTASVEEAVTDAAKLSEGDNNGQPDGGSQK